MDKSDKNKIHHPFLGTMEVKTGLKLLLSHFVQCPLSKAKVERRFLSLLCLPGRRNMPFHKYFAQVFLLLPAGNYRMQYCTVLSSPGDITQVPGELTHRKYPGILSRNKALIFLTR